MTFDSETPAWVTRLMQRVWRRRRDRALRRASSTEKFESALAMSLRGFGEGTYENPFDNRVQQAAFIRMIELAKTRLELEVCWERIYNQFLDTNLESLEEVAPHIATILTKMHKL